MKNTLKYLAVSALSLLAVSCTIDYIEPDQSKLPQASELTPKITVDQETNYVTLEIEDKGVVPVWIIGDELIDGKPSKKYAYTQNGVSLRFRDAGTHSVELKAYNANGISQGSQIVTFTLDNTYRDPFDPTPYMKAIANTWTWDKETQGHFGCGPSFANPTGWWPCGPNGKDGVGLYDDLMTFTADGSYTFDPGKEGTVYVNWGSGFKPEGHEEEIASETDYQAPIETYTHTYSIENSWNDAGFEEIYLVLEPGDNLSYIPNPEALTTNGRYQFVNTKAADNKKNLVLVNSTPGISWKYSFIPFVKGVTKEDLLAGTTDAGKVWVMDSDAPGHLGCGETGDNPTGWWAASANEKSAFGMYDDELTFYPGGKFAFNPGADGKIYINKGVTKIGTPGASEDYDIEYSAFESTYSFDGDAEITFPAETIIGYVPFDDVLTDDWTFVITELSETTLKGYVYTATGNGGGSIAWQYIFKARDVKAPDMAIGGVEFAGGKANITLENGKSYPVVGIDLSTKWIDPDYFELENATTLKFIGYDGDYQVMNQDKTLHVVPMSGSDYATYDDGAIWIIGEGISKVKGGNAPGWTTDAAVDIPLAKTGEHSYKLTAYISAPNFKFFGQPAWGKEFGGDNFGTVETNDFLTVNGYPGGAASDNGNIWSGDAFAAGWYVITVVDNGGTLDMTVDQWKKETVVYDITGEGNIWRKVTVDPEYWYSPASWAGGIDADAEIGANNDFTANIPEGVGGSEWMAQNKLHTHYATDPSKDYDFCCTLTATEDMEITIKLTGDPEKDGDKELPIALMYDREIKLTAGESFTYQRANLSAEMGTENFTLIFDFGRSPIGSTIEVTNICFQEHNAQVVVVE